MNPPTMPTEPRKGRRASSRKPTPTPTLDRAELGLRMQGWHASQADPIYAVGSFYFSGEVYPDRDVVDAALSGLECELDKSRRMARGEKVSAPHAFGRTDDLKRFAGYTRRTLRANIADLREIVAALRAFIALDYEAS